MSPDDLQETDSARDERLAALRPAGTSRPKQSKEQKNRETKMAIFVVFGSLTLFFLLVLILIMSGKLGTLLNFRAK